MFWRWGWAKLAGVQLSGYRVRGRVAFKDVYILTVSNIEIVGGNSYILFFRVRILSLGTLLNRSETDLGCLRWIQVHSRLCESSSGGDRLFWILNAKLFVIIWKLILEIVAPARLQQQLKVCLSKPRTSWMTSAPVMGEGSFCMPVSQVMYRI